MKRVFTRAALAAILLGTVVPTQSARADGSLNWYFYPFEYCANTCTYPICCRTP
jgi:hypothetical protein